MLSESRGSALIEATLAMLLSGLACAAALELAYHSLAAANVAGKVSDTFREGESAGRAALARQECQRRAGADGISLLLCGPAGARSIFVAGE